jgi:hypothetical protein
MRLLLINLWFHQKNLNALYNYNYDIDTITNINLDNIDLSKYDAVYSPSMPIDVKKYPKTKFIFGPHFSVFPSKEQMDLIRHNNVIYTQPGNWVRDDWRNNSNCSGIKIETLPFGVDTVKFNEIKKISDRNEVFIYYKSRIPSELNKLKKFMDANNISYKLFSYTRRYSENDYLNCLQNAKFGIWLGRHESQGFALEEALSCNVPLLVWNVTSMNQEYNSSYDDIPATTIPYWDSRCGEYFTNYDELQNTFNNFISKINEYKPRDFILENLSMKICNKIFDNLILEN